VHALPGQLHDTRAGQPVGRGLLLPRLRGFEPRRQEEGEEGVAGADVLQPMDVQDGVANFTVVVVVVVVVFDVVVFDVVGVVLRLTRILTNIVCFVTDIVIY
jgi:hypothetical protein